jgi:rhodanese-related sulfurtransferase
MAEIDAERLAAELATAEPVVLDVREDWELAICSLPGAQHIPLGELPARHAELNRERRTIVICHHGVRSQVAQAFLLERGFREVINLEGGIDAWARRVDPEMSLY